MATGFSVQWKVLSNDFPKIIATMETKAEAFVAKAALDIEAHAKGLAAVDTGTLKNSIQASRVGSAHWRVIVGADYGMYVEYGTVKAAAQPFLRPAVSAVSPGFLQALRQVVIP